MGQIDFENIEIANGFKNKYLNLCKSGKYLEAIKSYIDDTGCGLADAKAYVDNLCSEYGLQPQKTSGGGCLVVICILFVLTSLMFL